MNKKNINLNLLFALIAGIITASVSAISGNCLESNVTNGTGNKGWQIVMTDNPDSGHPDFTNAAKLTVHGVVHVKATREREGDIRDPLEFFFGPREREQEPEEGFGSGVIITDDGYIVTNHHVIDGADDIEVTTHDKRMFNAEVLGKDPNTDIAVLKIDATDLSYINFGNSDDLEIGEWVLAVGNPFGLTSSVTAGIISAKERALGALREGEMPVESFLQTDAAVNVGNSGGALVNLKGELVGVPTLIISPTRTHIGTAFAVPSDIVKIVAESIIEYGEVRRGVLGVSISEVTPSMAEKAGLEEATGIYIEGVVDGSAAYKAGIQRGDIIIEVNNNTIASTSDLQREIIRHQPGERVDITLIHNGRRSALTAELLSMKEQRKLVLEQEETLLGATFKMVPQELKEKFNLPGGIQVSEIGPGELQEVGMSEGFIIVAVNNQLVSEPAHISYLLEDYSGNVIMRGVYPDGTPATYAFTL